MGYLNNDVREHQRHYGVLSVREWDTLQDNVKEN